MTFSSVKMLRKPWPTDGDRRPHCLDLVPVREEQCAESSRQHGAVGNILQQGWHILPTVQAGN